MGSKILAFKPLYSIAALYCLVFLIRNPLHLIPLNNIIIEHSVMLLPEAVGCECISYLRVVIENVFFPSFFFCFLIVNNVLSPCAITQQHSIKQTFKEARFTSNNVT